MSSTSNIITLREVTSPDYVSRVYVHYTGLSKPVHVSSLHDSAIREVVLQSGNVEYLLDASGVRELYIYEVVYFHRALHVKCYQLVNGHLKRLDDYCTIVDTSTGNKKLDELVGEVVKYRAFWSTKLCEAPAGTLKAYDAVLKARAALDYFLFKRLKETWLTYSSEYLGFAYALLHSILGERGFAPVETQLEEVCGFAERVNEPRWRGVVINYTNGGLNVNVSLERRVGWVVPDLLITTPRGSTVIECKQGPPVTWLTKAIKQAKGYKLLIPAALVLLTPRELDLQERERLLKHYDYVVYSCTVENYDACKNELSRVL
ncbi:MAG: hypothetical protein QXP03_00515 [Desulfurococcaceae archaeon]